MSDTPVNPFDDAEEIAKKSMVLFFLIDCSGSMGGSKIGTVNSVMEELIPEIKGIGGADADIQKRVHEVPEPFVCSGHDTHVGRLSHRQLRKGA